MQKIIHDLWNKSLLTNIRFYILAVSFLVSLGFYIWISFAYALSISRIAQLEEIYALISIFFLYLSLLAGPFCYRFKNLPGTEEFLFSRRALGVAAFYFALLHTLIAFFGELGGFSGIAFLDSKYLFAIGIAVVALIIMAALAVTSFDYMINKMTFSKWLFLHRFVYLAAILTLIHTVMLGTYFSNLSDTIPQILFFALAFLLFLEAPRFDNMLARTLNFEPKMGITTVLFAIILTGFYIFAMDPFSTGGAPVSFDIHAAHIELAKQVLQQTQNGGNSIFSNPAFANIPGLNGDRTKRYTISLDAPDDIEPNEDTTLKFRIYDASSGNIVTFFRAIYAKPMHLMIVDSSLTYFSHIHPTQVGSDFEITTQFPQPGIYHLYTEFQPFGGIEQQDGFEVSVGLTPDQTVPVSNQPVDKNLTKTFGNYQLTLNTHGTLSANAMTIGQNTISFTIRDAKTKKPVTNLKPYLAAFGHLTMINEKTYDFIHVHPTALVAPPPNANGGPTVDFLPIGIYGPFKPGIYRMFLELNPNNQLFTSNFTVRIEE